MAVPAGRLAGKVALPALVINNAGIMLLQVPEAECRRMFDINVMGTLSGSRHALPLMIERKGGRIVNLSTKLAQRPVGGGGFAA